MRRLPAAPALLLAAWLLPLAAQVGTLLQLLDAGASAHPATMVEILVHGHPHAGRVPGHGHSICTWPAVGDAKPRPAASPAVTGAPGAFAIAMSHPRVRPLASAGQAFAAASLRHLPHGVLRL